MRDDFHSRFQKERDEFDRQFDIAHRLNRAILFGILAFYAGIAAILLMGCYALFNALS